MRQLDGPLIRAGIQARLEVPLVVALQRLGHGRRMLEVGRGAGTALSPLARLCRPSKLTGLDIDPELLADASQALSHTRIELVHGDIRDMPFPDATYDIVIDFLLAPFALVGIAVGVAVRRARERQVG